MVDIIVTYLNERDKKWQEDFKYWKDKEIKSGIASKINRQAFGVERTREWDAFKYWFRGVEKNCPWVRKVFLIVQNKNHVPDWLDVNHSKLRIVYHEEYIPKELLPTFNAMTIGMYISNIKDLSENYIMCDDDFYFLNPIAKNRFFKGGRPVHRNNFMKYELYGGDLLTGSDNVFYHILNNDLKFESKFNRKIKYGIYHLPEARLKSMEKKILTDYADEIKQHNLPSKFRSPNNLCSYMYSDLLKIFEKAEIGNPYYNCCYCTLKSTVNFNEYENKDIVCFNDTEQLDDYEKTKKRFIEFLDKKFPDKSSYERG